MLSIWNSLMFCRLLFTKQPILGWSKLNEYADDKIKVAKMMIFVFDRVENILGKGESSGYLHFFVFTQCFQEIFFTQDC